jgi:activator of 2-hydroxyglutaryl-CoA dehydratase
MGALESAFTMAEKALVVVPPAQAAVGAAGAALKDLRVSC